MKLPSNEVQMYQLSTAENELGVVIAYSEAGKLFSINSTLIYIPQMDELFSYCFIFQESP